jgi:hypothetical protein
MFIPEFAQLKPFYSLQILSAPTRYQSLQIHSQSPSDYSPHLTTNDRKLTTVRITGIVCLSELSSVPVRGWPYTSASIALQPHSLDGKEVSEGGRKKHTSHILITSSPAEVNADTAEG